MALNSNIRFFTYAFCDNAGLDVVEVTESQFIDLCGHMEGKGHLATQTASISYERHTTFSNGSRGICLTVDSIDTPYVGHLDLVEE